MLDHTLRYYAARFFILVSLLLPAQSKVAYAQNIIPEKSKFYSIQDGLSERFITSITQSKDGLVWVGTINGLNKFDGYEFLTFSDNPEASNRISDSNISHMALCKDGRILIVYRNKSSFFDLLDPYTHRTVKVNLTAVESGIRGIIRQISTNRQGDILLLATSQEGIFVYRFEPPNRFQPVFTLSEQRPLTTAATRLLSLTDQRYLLYDSEKGLRLLEANGKLLRQFSAADFSALLPVGASPGEPLIMHEDRQGNVWVSFSDAPGVFKLDKQSLALVTYEKVPPLSKFFRIWEDQKGNLIFAQTKDLSVYPSTNQLLLLRPDQTTADLSALAIANPRIMSLYGQDFNKTIFLGLDSGLKIVQTSSYPIKKLLDKPLSGEQRGNIIRGIDGNQEKVYWAEEGGLWFALDRPTNRLDTLQLNDPETGLPLEVSCMLDLKLDSQGALWGIACNNFREGLLIRYNLAKDVTEVFKFEDRFRAFTRARNGKFWLLAETSTGNARLVQFDPTSRTFDTTLEKQYGAMLKNASPYYILEDRQGTLWLGTNVGLIRIDLQKGISKTYQIQTGADPEGLRSNSIYLIHQDRQGLLWLGTANGLSVLDPATHAIRTYDHRHGLVSNTVCGLVPDEKDNFWISTFNGLTYFDRQRYEFHNFYAQDGLTHDEFNRFSFYQDADGYLYFGTVNGLNIFKADDLIAKNPPPVVVITKIIRYNARKNLTAVQYENLNPLNSLTVAPGDTYLELHFALPEFNDPSRNQFSTWLEGYEKDWTYQGNNHSIRYTNLPPGNYTLHIKGADPNGNWNQKPLKVRIWVKRAFHQTVWFWLIIASILGIVAYVAFRYQWEQKLQMERFRIKVSSDLHDELSGLLSGIALQTDMLQMMTEDETIKSRMRHIGEVSRKAMSKMSDVIWSIDSRKDKLGDLLNRMREHADDMLLPLNIKYTLETKRLDAQQTIPPAIRQELYLIFKEAINNIVKHSNANVVQINLQNAEGQFLMEIKDNGQGIPKVLNGKNYQPGQGLSNIKMRAQRINAKIELLKEEGYSVKLRMKKFA